MTKVSIVTPSYNHARFLPDRISSILGQTLQEFEWIIIDDCSTDGSQVVLQRLTGHDPRVRLLFHAQNMGMAATTREAIALSSGEYVYRAESDDACDNRFLQRMVEVLDANPSVGFAFCRALTMDEHGRLWGGHNQPKRDAIQKGDELFRRLVMNNFICGGNIVFRRSAHDEVGGFGLAPLQVACDWHFTLRMCLAYDVAYLSEPLGYHRVHVNNYSNWASKAFDLDSLFRESYEPLLDVFRRMSRERNDLQTLRRSALRKMTTGRFARLYVQMLLHQERGAADQMLHRIRYYDPGASKGLSWAAACVPALFELVVSNPLKIWLSRAVGSWRLL